MTLDLALLLALPMALTVMGLAGLAGWAWERWKQKRRGLVPRSTEFKANSGVRR